MKTIHTKAIMRTSLCVLLSGMLLICGCDMFRPIEPPTAPTPPAEPSALKDVVIAYNYNATDNVQLSANDVLLKVGQKLILQPAPGLAGETRFSSSGEHFFGEIMKQEPGQSIGKAVFTAIKPGKGKLQIIPNGTETDRATDLWVTVQ